MRQYTRDRMQPVGLENMRKLAGCIVYVNGKRLVGGRYVYVRSFSDDVGYMDYNGIRYTVQRTITDDGEYWTAQEERAAVSA